MTRWAQPDLVLRAMAGDETASEELIRAIWAPCFRIAASLTGDAAAAEDAAQETCIIVHHKIGSLRNAQAFDSWLYRIVGREAIRARSACAPVVPERPIRGFGNEVHASIDVWRALATLPHDLRDVTVLFYFDDLPSDAIAHLLDVPHATVRTRLARARERLRDVLGEYARTPVAERTQSHAG